MPETESTPGPWRVSWSTEGQSWFILNEDGRMIANAFESEINARRMAAAPEMEKAMEGVLGICGHCLFDERWKPVSAALAKAKEETPNARE